MDTTKGNSFKFALIGAGGAGLGAGVMYLSDPDRGRYRRALMRDKFIHWRTFARRRGRIAWLDLSHRTRGQVAELRSRLFPEEVSDDVLVARVATQLGRLVTAPHPIELTAEAGTVVLSGPIFTDEIEPMIAGISKVRGVKQIVNKMQLRERTEKDPPRHANSARTTWTPSTRLLVSLGSMLFSAGAAWFVFKSRGKPDEGLPILELSDEEQAA